jgi:hypothetical protein
MTKAFLMRWIPLALTFLTLSSQAGTIYMCKASNGGTFWSAADCGQHGAMTEQIVRVPENLSFDQQVKLAEQQRSQAECTALDARVLSLDDLARQPQSAQTQDSIRDQRKMARDRQYALRCR